MSYIRLNGEDVILYGEVKPDDEHEYIYVKDIPHIDILTYQKLIYKDGCLYVVTDVEALRNDILSRLLNTYKSIIKQTDDEYFAYQKRKELEMKNNKDDNDYANALQLYKEKTEWYRTEKSKVETMTENELIEYYRNLQQ